jgi:hypothetical protein
MGPEEIFDMYDTNPDLTLGRLAYITGWTVKELKTLLQGG